VFVVVQIIIRLVTSGLVIFKRKMLFSVHRDGKFIHSVVGTATASRAKYVVPLIRPCGRTKVASVGYFPSTEFLCFFHFSPTNDLAPFSIYAPQKTPLLTHKLSILQLNQATFDLPGSAIIRPTDKPS